MSFESYAKWWIKTKGQIEQVRKIDQQLLETTKLTQSRKRAGKLAGGLYARYCMLVQEIDVCLDQMCQAQKRITVHKLMDAAVTRLKELKEELVNIDLSEYHYIDGNLIELKLVPQDVEIIYPALFYHRPIAIQELWERLQNGERIYVPPKPPEPPSDPDGSLSIKDAETKSVKLEGTPSAEAVIKATAEAEPTQLSEGKKDIHDGGDGGTKAKKKPQKLGISFLPEKAEPELEDQKALKRKEMVKAALLVIQAHERARQSRIYFFEMNVERKMRDAKPNQTNVLSKVELNAAATKLQKTWRGHVARETMKRRDEQKKLLIGMTEPSWKSKEEKEKLQKILQDRRLFRNQRIKEYVEANLAEKDRVLRVIGPGIMEDIGDELRYYFYNFYRKAVAFDEFPTVEQGGSILIVRGETMTPEEWLADQWKKWLDKQKIQTKDKKKEAELKAKKKAEEKARKKKEREQKKKEARKAKNKEFEFKFKETPAKAAFEEGFEEYRRMWDEINDLENPTETHYMDMITEEKCYQMHLELRPVVDELMRIELELLQDALELDKWRAKGKKGKPKKKKNKKKGGKKKKKKKNKDLTANRTTEDLFQELYDNGIIHTYEPRRLEDFRGDYSYKNYYLRNLEFDPPATLGDVRQVVALNCIMPLGVGSMQRPRSVLIAGARQSGKHLLANAIFTETQCVLFDLSPPILAGKYKGKKASKMLVHLINKMSRILQPSIIFIDGAEKPFYKKVPKDERSMEPKKMGKSLFKGIVKTITPDDRVLVLGISRQPFAAKFSGLKKAFEKVILIPRPDYGSVMLYWRELLNPYHGVDRNFNVTALTTVTTGFPFKQLKDAAETVLTAKRIVQLKYKPLQAAELYEAILTSRMPEPITDKEWNKFMKWFGKYPLAKKRKVLMDEAEKVRQMEKAQAEKKKNKK